MIGEFSIETIGDLNVTTTDGLCEACSDMDCMDCIGDGGGMVGSGFEDG
jgi:hypothetical protein